jgi:hypothetical protein
LFGEFKSFLKDLKKDGQLAEVVERAEAKGLKEKISKAAEFNYLRLKDLNLVNAYSGGCRTLIPISVGQGSNFCRTLFRFMSDSVPG